MACHGRGPGRRRCVRAQRRVAPSARFPFSRPDSLTRVSIAVTPVGGRQVLHDREPGRRAGRAGPSRSASWTRTSTVSIPRMLGVDHDPQVIDGMMIPPVGAGASRSSRIGMSVPDGQAVIWRSHAPPRPPAVSAGRVLGRPGRPVYRHASGKGRRRDFDPRSCCPTRDLVDDPQVAAPPRSLSVGRLADESRRSSASSKTCRSYFRRLAPGDLRRGRRSPLRSVPDRAAGLLRAAAGPGAHRHRAA